MTSRYPRRIIYTKISAALSSGPLVVPLDWLQPLSLPVLRKPDHAAQAASGGLDEFTQPAAPEVVTLDKWYAALSEPTRRRRCPEGQAVDEFTQFAAPETITLDKWYAGLSEPRRRLASIFGPELADVLLDIAAPPAVPDLPTWYQALSEPTRRKHFDPSTKISAALTSTTPAVLASFDWLQPLSVPVHPKRLGYVSEETSPLLDIATVPDITMAWNQQEPDVTRSRWSLWRLATAPEWGSNVEIEPGTWFQPLSEPVRRKHFDPSTKIAAALATTTPPIVQVLNQWYQPASTPTLPKERRIQAGEFAPDVTDFAAPETITLDKWFQPAGEPIRIRLHPNRATGESAPVFTPAEEIFGEKWDMPLSRPMLARNRRNPATGESAPVFVDPPPPPAPDYGWFMALVGPVPRLVSRRAALAQAYGDPNIPLPGAPVADDDWTDTTQGGGTWSDVTPAGDIWTDVPPSSGNWG